MANRETYPASLTPLTGDVSAGAGATGVTVTGLQTYPVQATTPSNNQVLQFTADPTQPHGGSWAPATLASQGMLQVNSQTLSDDAFVAVNGIDSPYDGVEFFRLNGQVLLATSRWPDMGAGYPTVASKRDGYGITYVTDKDLANCTIGASGVSLNGGLRFNQTLNQLQLWANGQWNNLAAVSLRYNLANSKYAAGLIVEFQGNGLTVWMDVFSGNSDEVLAINGLPLVRNAKTCIGAFPAPVTINCGSF